MVWMLILTVSVSHATHLMGGEMSIVFVGNSNTGVPQYEVHCFVYRDCSSANTNGTGFDLFASIAIYEGNLLLDDMSLQLDPALVENVNPENPNNCAFLPEDLCLERAEYIGIIALPPSNLGYTFVYQRCCRSPAITNLLTPQEQGFTIKASVPPTGLASAGNSSPVFDALPQAFVCNQYPFSISHAATDADGDSLAYSICDIFLGASPDDPMPVPPGPPPYSNVSWSGGFNPANPFGLGAGLTMNPATGEMTGIPQQVGKYAIGICVEEWRNGVMIGAILRDFTIDVVMCEVLAPFYEPIASCEGMTVAFEQFSTPADSYAWDFGDEATDADTSSLAEPNHTYVDPGIYNISLFFSTGGCSDSLHFEVAVAEPWSADFAFGEWECNENDSWDVLVTVDMSGWPPGTNWTWTTSSSSEAIHDSMPAVFDLPPGDQTLSLHTAWHTCEASSTELLTLPDMPSAGFSMTTSPCGELEASFLADDPASGPFLWTFGGSGASASGPAVDQPFPAFGNYDVTLVAGVGSACESSESATIALSPPNPLAGDVTVAPLSYCDSTGWVQVALEGITADEVTWNWPLGAEVVSADASGATVFLPEEGTFAASVLLTNWACEEEMDLAFDIDISAPLSGVNYVLPNVFSPNNDGRNERFAVMQETADGNWVGLPASTSFEGFDFRVFNRWGTEVFATKNPAAGWWGGGAAAGAHFWTLQAKHVCDDAPAQRQGVVTIVR